eukprot:GHVU01223028.1.p1 GENE.GHVU01223028.1~~GHVU01223028.1.p1  ORF type:complete len:188 (+),score=19.63 GHVU01223028.1:1327-1890(+)
MALFPTPHPPTACLQQRRDEAQREEADVASVLLFQGVFRPGVSGETMDSDLAIALAGAAPGAAFAPTSADSCCPSPDEEQAALAGREQDVVLGGGSVSNYASGSGPVSSSLTSYAAGEDASTDDWDTQRILGELDSLLRECDAHVQIESRFPLERGRRRRGASERYCNRCFFPPQFRIFCRCSTHSL